VPISNNFASCHSTLTPEDYLYPDRVLQIFFLIRGDGKCVNPPNLEINKFLQIFLQRCYEFIQLSFSVLVFRSTIHILPLR
jgi:hypothetical protein